jgi:hypothetical protein
MSKIVRIFNVCYIKLKRMNNWKNALYGQMAYMIGMGLSFLFIPNLFLSLVGLPETDEIWIRILGLLALVLNMYYYNAIRHNTVTFARASMWGRLIFCAGIAVLAVLFSLPIIIAFAAFEAGLALWTMWTLRQAA